MTVTTAYSVLTYNCNGSVTAFSVTWPFEYSSELVVTHIAATGVETVLTLTTDYTVSGGRDGTTGLNGTGTVTTLTAYASGHKIRITRSTPKTQQTSITTSGAFPAKTIEAMVDRVHRIAEEGGFGGGTPDIDGAVLRLETSGATDYWDGEDYIARGFADGVNDDDLATKGQVDAVVDLVADEATAAAASAAAAASSASSASSSASTATTAAGTATTAATAAAASATAAGDSADAAAASAAAAEAAANGEIGANTILGNNTGSTAAASALSVSAVKTLLSLSNVNDTADADKPVSTATQAALDLKAPLASPTFTGTAAMATATVSSTLTVTGAATLSSSLALTGALNGSNSVRLGASSPLYWSLRASVYSPADAEVNFRNYANSAYAIVRGATPVGSNDFTTKDYVDTAVASAGSEWVEIGDTTIGSAVANVEVTWTAGTYAMVVVIFSDLSGTATTELTVSLRNSGGTIVDMASTATPIAANVATGYVEFVIGLDASTKLHTGRGFGVYASGSSLSMPSINSGANATAPDRIRVAYNSGNIDDGRIIVKGLLA